MKRFALCAVVILALSMVMPTAGCTVTLTDDEHNQHGMSLANQGNHEGVSQVGIGLLDLGVPDGCVWASAYAVNDSEQVVGECWLPDKATTGAFLWDRSNGFKILLPPGWRSSRALDINNLGQVVGHGYVGSVRRVFVWDETNGYIDLGLPKGYTTCAAYAINNQGQIVGSVGNNQGQIIVGSSGSSRAFIWDRESGFTILGVPEGCVSSSARDINNLGQVAGDGYTGMAECYRAFVWDRQSGFTNLGLPSDLDESMAHIQVADINDNGQVVGSGRGQAVGSTTGKTFSYLWSKADGFVDLGIPPGCYYFEKAAAVNNEGQVTGDGLAGEGRTVPVVWDKHGGLTIIEFPANWTHTHAYDINNSGTVVGTGSTEEGRRAYLFRTP